MTLFFILLLAAVALGIVGVAVSGLFYLLVVGIAIVVLDLVFAGYRLRGRRHRVSR